MLLKMIFLLLLVFSEYSLNYEVKQHDYVLILIPTHEFITSFHIIYFVAGEIRAYSAPSFISAKDQTGRSIFYVLQHLVHSNIYNDLSSLMLNYNIQEMVR